MMTTKAPSGKYYRTRLTDGAENALIKAGCYNLNDKRIALQVLTELYTGVQDHDKDTELYKRIVELIQILNYDIELLQQAADLEHQAKVLKARQVVNHEPYRYRQIADSMTD